MRWSASDGEALTVYQSEPPPIQPIPSENKLQSIISVLESADHAASVQDWARLLALADPGEYADPPAPTDVILTSDREKRIALMAARVGRGEAAVEPAPVDTRALARLGMPCHRNRNGSDNAGRGQARPEGEARHVG